MPDTRVQEPGRFHESWTTPNDVELGVVAEPRRPGEVSIQVITDDHIAWVPAAEARRFAMALLAGAREAEGADPHA